MKQWLWISVPPPCDGAFVFGQQRRPEQGFIISPSYNIEYYAAPTPATSRCKQHRGEGGKVDNTHSFAVGSTRESEQKTRTEHMQRPLLGSSGYWPSSA